MDKEAGEAEEEQLLEALEDIAPSKAEFINRRINHINFARVVFWLCVKCRNNEFVYASELSKFIKVTQTRGYMILNDLSNVEIMRKKFPTSNLIEFWFEYEGETPIITKYFEQAKKTLGVKFKLTLRRENDGTI